MISHSAGRKKVAREWSALLLYIQQVSDPNLDPDNKYTPQVNTGIESSIRQKLFRKNFHIIYHIIHRPAV
jgi:hypothetical protein